MKKGTILFVTEGRDELDDHLVYLKQARDLLGVQSVCLATSEDDVAYAWWRMLAKGMHQVSIMKVAFRAQGIPMELRGTELRLCG